MFSLIVTLLSIALVAALAIATMYYLRASFTVIDSRAQASTVLSQAEQLAGGARVFKAYSGAYPSDLAQLQSNGYLKAGPQYRGQMWVFLGANTPAFVLPGTLSLSSCQALNSEVRHDTGIHPELVASQLVQCFGTSAPYSVVVHLEADAALGPALAAVVPGATVVPSEADATWTVTP